MTGEVADIALMTDGPRLDQRSDEWRRSSLTATIARAQAGDKAAFEEIIAYYQRRVAWTAWRMLGNEDDARDAAQETSLRAYKYLHRFDQQRDFSGWLYRVVVNVCRDIARKRPSGRIFASLEEEMELGHTDALAASDDVEAAAIASQENRIVADALGTLSRKEREAIVLRDLEGLSTDEVARMLGTSQATVRSQISSARVKIKRYHDRLLRRRRQR
ncbi:MAG TPA: sigma-70 family RNA polymerase sigma factor [Blastocatellia bacterium]|nr:sigma-70 family RNA polymerase sigma factor [Blastocatellia bacterium]